MTKATLNYFPSRNEIRDVNLASDFEKAYDYLHQAFPNAEVKCEVMAVCGGGKPYLAVWPYGSKEIEGLAFPLAWFKLEDISELCRKELEACSHYATRPYKSVLGLLNNKYS